MDAETTAPIPIELLQRPPKLFADWKLNLLMYWAPLIIGLLTLSLAISFSALNKTADLGSPGTDWKDVFSQTSLVCGVYLVINVVAWDAIEGAVGKPIGTAIGPKKM